VAVLSLPTLATTLARWKPLGKGSVDGLATAGPDQPLLAVSGERAAVWGVPGDGRVQDAMPLISLDNFLPVGTKKAAKVYTVACHPLLTHVVAVGANSGVSATLVQHPLLLFRPPPPPPPLGTSSLLRRQGSKNPAQYLYRPVYASLQIRVQYVGQGMYSMALQGEMRRKPVRERMVVLLFFKMVRITPCKQALKERYPGAPVPLTAHQ